MTNTETGPAPEKPAFLIEANIHAIEVTGCAAALHLIHRLLAEHGTDDQVTRALDTRAFYVIPRLNPDGAELASPTGRASSARACGRTRSQTRWTGSTRRTSTATGGS